MTVHKEDNTLSEQQGTATKPSWKQRFGRILAIAVCVIGVLLAFQTGVIRLAVPGANSDSQVAELETALEEARSAAEEAASGHRDEVSELQQKLREAESELARLRPIVEKYQGEFDVASAARLAAELQEANGNLSSLARRYADHALELADVNSSLGAAASVAGDLDLAREFLEHWENFQRDKGSVDDALAKLSPEIAPVLEIATGDVDSGESRVRMERAQSELRRAKAALEQGTTRLDALVRLTQGLTARATTLREAWTAKNSGKTLTGPTARELIDGFDNSDEGQKLAARQAIWLERLTAMAARRDFLQIPEGMSLEKLVHSTAFANYIAEFERTYTQTAARKKYLGHTVDGNWQDSPSHASWVNNQGRKTGSGQQWKENSLGIQTATFGIGDWKFLMGNSREYKFPQDANYQAELDYFTEYFIAMVVGDVGPNGEPALPIQQ